VVRSAGVIRVAGPAGVTGVVPRRVGHNVGARRH
jgi:hypothetical protein